MICRGKSLEEERERGSEFGGMETERERWIERKI